MLDDPLEKMRVGSAGKPGHLEDPAYTWPGPLPRAVPSKTTLLTQRWLPFFLRCKKQLFPDGLGCRRNHGPGGQHFPSLSMMIIYRWPAV